MNTLKLKLKLKPKVKIDCRLFCFHWSRISLRLKPIWQLWSKIKWHVFLWPTVYFRNRKLFRFTVYGSIEMYGMQTWKWVWPVHVYGFGTLLGALAIFCFISTILRVVMSERRRRWTSKLQRLNVAAVSFSLLRLLESIVNRGYTFYAETFAIVLWNVCKTFL